MGVIKESHLPCPECGSSDALSEYEDGGTYCFSCGSTKSSSEDTPSSGGAPSTGVIPHTPRDLNVRRIQAGTCNKFSYGVTEDTGYQVADYIDPVTKEILYQKVRTPDKRFFTNRGKQSPSGVTLKSMLFGRHIWGDSGGSKLLVCEGEIDTLTGYQALSPIGFHVVGIPAGAQCALQSLRDNISFLDGYQEIYLGFDNDKPGQEAAELCAKELTGGISGNIYILNIPPEHKDINDLWIAQGREGVLSSYQTARVHQPTGIIPFGKYLDIMNKSPQRGYDYPWYSLNRITYGIRPGLTIVTAGSGVGKTTMFKQIESHLLWKRKLILGVFHLEESPQDTINGLLTLLTGKPFNKPEYAGDTITRERLRLTEELATSKRLIMFDKQVGFDEDTIIASMRYMVKGLGAQVIFLDHLTALTDQYSGRDSNARTRNLIVKLAKLSLTLSFPLVMISHLRKSDGKAHEEGGRVHLDDLLGASAIKQWAEHVFCLERNNQDEDPKERNKPCLRDLKNRPLGQYTGTVIPLEFDPETSTLVEPPINRATSKKDSGINPHDDLPF